MLALSTGNGSWLSGLAGLATEVKSRALKSGSGVLKSALGSVRQGLVWNTGVIQDGGSPTRFATLRFGLIGYALLSQGTLCPSLQGRNRETSFNRWEQSPPAEIWEPNSHKSQSWTCGVVPGPLGVDGGARTRQGWVPGQGPNPAFMSTRRLGTNGPLMRPVEYMGRARNSWKQCKDKSYTCALKLACCCLQSNYFRDGNKALWFL